MTPKQQKQVLRSILVTLHRTPTIDSARLELLRDELSDRLSEGVPDGRLALRRAIEALETAIKEIDQIAGAADATKRLCSHAAQCLQAQEAEGLRTTKGALVLVGDGTAVWRTGRAKPVNV
jgi:hypothetical protein